jgi:hypothetical protein
VHPWNWKCEMSSLSYYYCHSFSIQWRGRRRYAPRGRRRRRLRRGVVSSWWRCYCCVGCARCWFCCVRPTILLAVLWLCRRPCREGGARSFGKAGARTFSDGSLGLDLHGLPILKDRDATRKQEESSVRPSVERIRRRVGKYR